MNDEDIPFVCAEIGQIRTTLNLLPVGPERELAIRNLKIIRGTLFKLRQALGLSVPQEKA